MTTARAIEATNDPLEYPWASPERSVLVRSISSSGVPELLPINPLPSRRLGFAQVELGTRIDSFDTVAKLDNQLWADYRYLVVAVGSNAAPSVMANKFRRRNKRGSQFFPIIKARVTNLGIGHFATVAPRGYIAATPFHSPGATATVWASWLSPDQFDALNSTEPGYTCRLVSAEDYPLDILHLHDDGTESVAESPGHYYLYDADAGYLTDAEGVGLDLLPQPDLYQRLAQIPELSGLLSGSPREVLTRLSAPGAAGRFEAGVHAAGLHHGPDIIGETGPERVPYLAISSLRAPDDSGDWLRVRPSRDGLDRGAEVYAVLPSRLAALHGDHVGVQAGVSNFHSQWSVTRRPPMVAAVHSADDLPEGCVEIDQSVRDGLGVGLNEYVRLVEARVPSSPLADALCPKRFLVARAQTADHTNMETETALVTPLTLSLLGIRDGDAIVVEGVPGPDGRVPELRMRAVAMTDEVQQRRAEVTNSHAGLYASARPYLGVHPDIAPLLIDRSARIALNLGSQRLVPVRIRASRKAQLVSELRELMLVLFIAFIGIISMLPNTVTALGVTGLLVVSAIALTLSRVRSSIGRAPSPRRAR